MARDTFIPAKQLNLLAAGWIQFNLHDWFDHGPVDVSRRIRIELDEDDPVYNKHKGEMKIPRTKPDSCQMYSVNKQSVYHLRLCLFLNDSWSRGIAVKQLERWTCKSEDPSSSRALTSWISSRYSPEFILNLFPTSIKLML